MIPILLKVMRDQNGISKGSGFVAFSTTEEADRAVSIFFFLYCLGTIIYSSFIFKLCTYNNSLLFFVFDFFWTAAFRNEWENGFWEATISSTCPA
jgi:RNA recognition motif-containing protein